MPVTVKLPTPLTLTADPRDARAVLEAFVGQVVARTTAGKGPAGASLGRHVSGPNKGRPRDMIETGRMLSDWTITETGKGRAQAVATAPYSGVQQARYGWADADKDTEADVGAALADSIDRRLRD